MVGVAHRKVCTYPWQHKHRKNVHYVCGWTGIQTHSPSAWVVDDNMCSYFGGSVQLLPHLNILKSSRSSASPLFPLFLQYGNFWPPIIFFLNLCLIIAVCLPSISVHWRNIILPKCQAVLLLSLAYLIIVSFNIVNIEGCVWSLCCGHMATHVCVTWFCKSFFSRCLYFKQFYKEVLQWITGNVRKVKLSLATPEGI